MSTNSTDFFSTLADDYFKKDIEMSVEFFLDALTRHLNCPHPESKLSVIYQYLVLVQQKELTSQQTQLCNQLEERFNAFLARILENDESSQDRASEENSKDSTLDEALRMFTNHASQLLKAQDQTYRIRKDCPNIPEAYWATDAVDFKELLPHEKNILNTTVRPLISLLDSRLYLKTGKDQDLTDAYYISYEWLIYKKTFTNTQHQSYELRQDHPYGSPYKGLHRMPPPLLTIKKEESDSDDEITEEPFQVTSTKPSFFETPDMGAVAKWTGRENFGRYLTHKKLGNDMRILVHSKGYVLFFPPHIYRPFDVQLNTYLQVADKPTDECWIAGPNFAFIKMDCLETEENTKERLLEHAEAFLSRNFIKKQGLYPENLIFSIGYCMDHPNEPKPFRLRLGGNFIPI